MALLIAGRHQFVLEGLDALHGRNFTMAQAVPEDKQGARSPYRTQPENSIDPEDVSVPEKAKFTSTVGIYRHHAPKAATNLRRIVATASACAGDPLLWRACQGIASRYQDHL
ncbi:hypothetical protein [Cupriavidus sp. CP313]